MLVEELPPRSREESPRSRKKLGEMTHPGQLLSGCCSYSLAITHLPTPPLDEPNPEGNGVLIDLDALGHEEAFSRSAVLLQAGEVRVFEAGMNAGGAFAYADFLRRVFPQRLISRDQCWYLVAWDMKAKDQRTYALPRISQVTVEPKPEGFVVPEFEDRYQHAFGILTPYESGGPLHEVCVELTGYWARIARERCWHPSQRLENLAADHVRVKFRLSELVEVKSWVLGFGRAARVIAPEELRKIVREEVEVMIRECGS